MVDRRGCQDFRISFESNTGIVFLPREIDHSNAERFRHVITKAIGNAAANGVILDCRELEFIDSSGLGVMIGGYHQANEQGKHISLKNTLRKSETGYQSSPIFRLLEITGLVDLFEIDNSSEP